jgi:hypothetical protein
MQARHVATGIIRLIAVLNRVKMSALGIKAPPELPAMTGNQALQLVTEQLSLNHNIVGIMEQEEIITTIGHSLVQVVL